MRTPRFDWDPGKSRSNLKKHRVSFGEAKTVFFDEGALVATDPDHSTEEDRFLIIGFSVQLRVHLVCFCERGKGDVIRIISARKATRKEQGHIAKENSCEKRM
jgi:uncharacterized DUF497 family protein